MPDPTPLRTRPVYVNNRLGVRMGCPGSRPGERLVGLPRDEGPAMRVRSGVLETDDQGDAA